MSVKLIEKEKQLGSCKLRATGTYTANHFQIWIQLSTNVVFDIKGIV